MNDQREREDKMIRSLGMTADAKSALAKAMDTQTDWYSVCLVCGEHLTGTLAQIKEHHHGK